MPLKRAEPRSIASQLVLLFTPAAAFLLCCGIGILYWTVVRHAFAEDRAALADQVASLRAELRAGKGPSMIAARLLRSSERPAYWVRLLDGGGHTLVETPGMLELLPPVRFANLEGNDRDFETQGKLFSLVSTTAAEEKNYTLQVAQDRTTDERFEKSFGFLVAAVLLGGIVASALLAITVTRRGLRPLASLTRSLRRVTPDRLDERVPLHEWPRELQPVAVAFDGMLDRLQDSFTRLSQFSADIAHELRTPLANIRGEAEVALTRPRLPNEYEAVIESSLGECERLTAIIDNLLFLARAEAAEGAANRERLDARAAVEKIAAYYEAIAEERQVRISCHAAGEIFADPLLFGRALSNLVDNALRFTPEGGTISITVETGAHSSAVTVRDSGAGISAQHLPRVFDRFYRADSSRSSEGTGLGLALVKSIAQLHGGSVEIASEVERGTIVTLCFPATDSPSDPAESSRNLTKSS